tara:strand:+ start:619 stop:1269 length:651 start_codon:yes stop_codon:yes gene_type:complete
MVSAKLINNFIKKKKFNDAWDIVDHFEKKVSKFCGSKYGIAVDCCTNAIFLSIKFINKNKRIIIPENTYVSILSAINLANHKFKTSKIQWDGSYFLSPYPIIDSATKFTKNMYTKKTLTCLSFHHRKHIAIGRGGMILTDSYKAYLWFKKARYDGRDLKINYFKDNISSIGWHMYMTPEQAYIGLDKLKKFKDKKKNLGSSITYKSIKNLSKFYKV